MDTEVDQAPRHERAGWRKSRALKIACGVGAWALTGAMIGGFALKHESRKTEVVSHEAVVTMTTDGHATIDGGALAPTIRLEVDEPLNLGTYIDLGPTTASSGSELITRYGAIAAQPKGEIKKVEGLAESMIVEAIKTGAVGGLATPMMWMAVGKRRRKELVDKSRQNAVLVGLGVSATALLVAPYIAGLSAESPSSDLDRPTWVPLSAEFPDIQLPAAARHTEVRANVITDEGANILRGAVLAFSKSQPEYDTLLKATKGIRDKLHKPEPGDVVMLLIGDRHDNINIDPTEAAIGKAAGATILLDIGDDTSTGQPWEAFSLDSLVANSTEYDERVEVGGNHDNGTFVDSYLASRGFVEPDGKIKAIGGTRMLGTSDPRSSGFVGEEQFTDVSLEHQAEELADTACKADAEGKRVSTLLVHESQMGKVALARGCVDLVLAGHIHHFLGPDKVVGTNGKIGYSFTTDTAGGAAYAVALGPLRREAGVTLLTYRNGVPIGLQKVTLEPSGKIDVSTFEELADLSENYTGESRADKVLPQSAKPPRRSAVASGVGR